MNEPELTLGIDKRVKSGLSKAVRENIDAAEHGIPWTDLAKEYGVKITTVYRRVAEERSRRRKLLRLKKQAEMGTPAVSEEVYDRPVPPNRASKKLSAEALLAEIDSSTVMTKEQRLKTLSYLANNAPDAVRVNAIAKLEEFERAAGAQFGPPPPTTDEEVVTYLTELFDGIHIPLIQKALDNVQKAPTVTSEASPDSMGGRDT